MISLVACCVIACCMIACRMMYQMSLDLTFLAKVPICARYSILFQAEFPSLRFATTNSSLSVQSIMQVVHLLGKYIIHKIVSLIYLVQSGKDFNLTKTIPEVWSAEMLMFSIITKQPVKQQSFYNEKFRERWMRVRIFWNTGHIIYLGISVCIMQTF